MNFVQSLKKQILLVTALTIFSIQLSAEVQLPYASDEEIASHEELVKLDQPFATFNTAPDGGYLTRFNPGPYTVEMTVWGTRFGEGEYDVRRPKKASEYENMEVVSWRLLLASAMVDIKKNYSGSRKYTVGIWLDTLMREIGVLDSEPFKRSLFVDAYLEAIPMKLILASYDEFIAVRKYLTKNFEKANVLSKADVKPLLVLDITEPGAFKKMTDKDVAFLAQYYTLCDRTNVQVKAFFEKGGKELYRAKNNMGGETKDTVGVKAGEYAFDAFEKSALKFKTPVIIGSVAATLATTYLISLVKDATKGQLIDPALKMVKDKKAYLTGPRLIGGAAAVLGLAMVIGYVKTQMEKSAKREKLLAQLEAAQQAALEQEAQEAAAQQQAVTA